MLGKPHPEQGRIEECLRAVRSRLPGWLLEAVGNGGPRGMIITFLQVTALKNRTRLTALSGHSFLKTARFALPFSFFGAV